MIWPVWNSVCGMNGTGARRTIAHGFHLRYEEDVGFEFENLTVILIHDFECLIDNCGAGSAKILTCFWATRTEIQQTLHEH